jgi:hypothetical protein
MSGDRPAVYLASLVRELCALPRETEWLEFKIDGARRPPPGALLWPGVHPRRHVYM